MKTHPIEQKLKNTATISVENNEHNKVAKRGLREKICIVKYDNGDFGLLKKWLYEKLDGILGYVNLKVNPGVINFNEISNYANEIGTHLSDVQQSILMLLYNTNK